MKIVVFADVHYYSGDIQTASFNKSRKLVQFAIPLLDRLADVVNQPGGADVCVNLGDIIQDVHDKQEDLASMQMMFERL